jgi:hypothetical protein
MQFGIDDGLHSRLEAWHKQIEKLATIEMIFRNLDASEKTLYSQLFLEAPGKNIEEKKAGAYTDQKWIDFKKGLAKAETEYHKERRILELKQKAYDGAYLSLKIDSDAIRRST